MVNNKLLIRSVIKIRSSSEERYALSKHRVRLNKVHDANKRPNNGVTEFYQ
jgi:hypothetical protein